MKDLLQLQECRAVSFDGDMTLWDFEKVMRHSLSKALSHLQAALPTVAAKNLTVDKMIAIRNQVAESLKGKVTHLEEIRLQAFVQTLRHVGSEDLTLASSLNALYLRHRFEGVRLYDDAKPALDYLHKHVPCGLISNGNSYPERCGLEASFSFVVFSQYVGAEKPDPAIFNAALQKIGCQAKQLVHVGDSLEADVAGANAVGAVSVWLNRDSRVNCSSIMPNFEIRTLEELPEIFFSSA